MKKIVLTNKTKMVKSLTKQNFIYYGWIVIFVCAAAVFFSGSGQTYFTSLFIESYIEDFGWSRSAISSIYSLATLCSGSLLFLVGRLADRHGQKKLLIIAALILALTNLWMANTLHMWMLFIGFFFLRFSGQGSMTLLPSIIVPNWFNKRRALSFSLVSLGGAIGSFLIPPLNAYLIVLLGWQMTYRVWSGLIVLIFIPIAYFFLFNKPEDVGLQIEDELKARQKPTIKIFKKKNTIADINDPTKNAGLQSASKATKADRPVKFKEVPSWQSKEAIKTRSFWFLIYIQMLLPMIGTGITFHFISIMSNRGISQSQAPFILSLLAITTLIATLLSGVLLNKMSIKKISIILTCAILVSIILLIFTNSLFTAIIYAIFHGSSNGIMAVWVGLTWPGYFGTRYLGSIRGLASTGNVLASALGPMPIGFIFDATASHTAALILFMAIAAIGIGFALILPKPQSPPIYKNQYNP